jgi:hypothetical protein
MLTDRRRPSLIDVSTGDDVMHDNRRLFSWLGYASLAVGLISDLLTGGGIGDTIFAPVVFVIFAVLVWAAAQGHRWAGWLFAIVTVVGVILTIGGFWADAPSWMRLGEPFEKSTTSRIILETVSALLAVAATYVYFFGGPAREATR